MGWRCGGCCGNNADTLAEIDFVHASFHLAPAFNIPAQAFTRLPVTAVTDSDALWDDADHVYTCPEDGTYALLGSWRPVDNTNTGASSGIGIDTVERDSTTFHWSTIQNGPLGSHTARTTFATLLVLPFSAGDQVRLFAYVDANNSTGLDSADLQIWRLATTID